MFTKSYSHSVLLLLIMIALLPTISNAQTNIAIGQKAPVIHITDWIANIPSDKNIANKHIVLEFWATWCGPCIAAVPHMNKLQKNIAQEDVYFISMTDESVEKVKRSLKRIDFQSIVVTDQTKATQINFGDGKKGLTQYPLTVLINKKGIIKWIGEPKEITQEILTKFITDDELIEKKITNGQKTTQSKSIDFMSLFKDKERDFYFELKESNSKDVDFVKKAIGNKLIALESASLHEIFKNIFDYTHIEIPASTQSRQFDLLYKNTDKQNSLIKLEKLLLEQLKLSKKTELRRIQINDVKVANKSLLEETLEKRFSAKSDAENQLIFTAYTIANMVKEINKVTADNYRYEGEEDTMKYDFIIRIDAKQATIDSFSSYGLQIEQKNKEQEYIVLEEK